MRQITPEQARVVLGRPVSRATRPAATRSRDWAPCSSRTCSGSYSGVMGLPLYETAQLLREAGIRPGIGSRRMTHRDPGQRRTARDACRAGRERRAAGGLHRARRAAAGWSATSTRAACRACCPACRRHSRHRPRAHRLPARRPTSCAAAGAGRCAPDARAGHRADIRALVRRGRRAAGAGREGSARHQGRAAHHAFIALPSRFLVYMPRGRRLGVSARIEDEAERNRLRDTDCRARARERRARRLHRAHRRAGRTAGGAARGHAVPGAPLGARARAGAARFPAGNLVHEDLPLPLRVLRDELVARGVGACWSTPASSSHACRRSPRAFMPEFADRIELHGGAAPDLRPARRRGGDRPGAGAEGARSNPAATWSSSRPRR